MGAALVYFFFTPMVMWFFLAMQQVGDRRARSQISLLPKVSEYLSLIMTLIFSFGLVFQLPVITTLLARVGFLTSQALARQAQMRDRPRLRRRRGADAAGSDVSQIGLALPTILLYEISIWTRPDDRAEREQERVAREEKAAADSGRPKGVD